MQIELVMLGKAHLGYVQTGLELYRQRLRPLLPFHERELPEPKGLGKLSLAKRLEKEGELLWNAAKSGWWPVLLDEGGKTYNSLDFKTQLEAWCRQGPKGVQFFMGGPDGFSLAMKEKVATRLSLTSMTLPHDLARLVFTEQVYRAATLWKGHPYHREG